MRKRTLSIVLAAAMCASLTACGGGGSTAETTAADSSNTETKAADASEKSDKPLRVCVVYTGNLGDKSYNDSCNMGAQKAVEDFGIELKSLEGTTAEEWKANLLQACDDGYDLIIGASSNIADYITENASSYPDTKFAVIDTTVDLPTLSLSALLRMRVPSWQVQQQLCLPPRLISRMSMKIISSAG